MAAYRVYQLLTKSYGICFSAQISRKRDLDPLESGNPLVVAGILNEIARFFRGRLQLSVACTQTVRKVMKFATESLWMPQWMENWETLNASWYCLYEQYFLMSLKVDHVTCIPQIWNHLYPLPLPSYTNQPLAWLRHNSRPIFIPSSSRRRRRRRRPIPGTWRKIAERCFPPSLSISSHSDKQSWIEEDIPSLGRNFARSASKIHDFWH